MVQRSAGSRIGESVRLNEDEAKKVERVIRCMFLENIFRKKDGKSVENRDPGVPHAENRTKKRE